MLNLERATDVVFAYLVGRKVDHDDLAMACAYLQREHPDTLKRLLGSLTAEPDSEGECEAVLQQAVEIAEMTDDQLKAEMPTLAAHLEHCPECEALIKSLRSAVAVSYWQTVRSSASAIAKKTTERIRVVLDQSGRLIESLGLPSEAVQPFAAAMSDKSLIPDRREWHLEDDELPVHICLTLVSRDSATFELQCVVSYAEGSQKTLSDVHLELVCISTGQTEVATRLSNLARSQLVLSAGVWSLRLKSVVAGRIREWEIEIELGVA